MRDCHCDCDYDEGDGEVEEEEEAYTGGKASMKWDSPIVGACENGRKGERAIYLLLLSFLFLFLGIIPLSVFDLFWHVSEPFVFVYVF